LNIAINKLLFFSLGVSFVCLSSKKKNASDKKIEVHSRHKRRLCLLFFFFDFYFYQNPEVRTNADRLNLNAPSNSCSYSVKEENRISTYKYIFSHDLLQTDHRSFPLCTG